MLYLLPLLAGIFNGIATLLNKKVANMLDNPWLSAFIFNVASTVVSAFLLLYDINNGGIVISTNIMDWVYVVMAMLLSAFAFWGMYSAMRELPVSEQILLSRFSILTYTIGGFLILGETVTAVKFIGILFVLSGIILSSIKKGKFVFNKWVILQILSAISFGSTVMIDKVASVNFSTGLWVFLNISTTTLALLVLAWFNGALKGLKEVPKAYYGYTSLAGGVMATAYYLLIASYDLGGLVTVVGALSQIKIVVAVVGGYILFKERNDLFMKFVGTATVIIGIILLNL